jgi:hypothetical protein
VSVLMLLVRIRALHMLTLTLSSPGFPESQRTTRGSEEVRQKRTTTARKNFPQQNRQATGRGVLSDVEQMLIPLR